MAKGPAPLDCTLVVVTRGPAVLELFRIRIKRLRKLLAVKGLILCFLVLYRSYTDHIMDSLIAVKNLPSHPGHAYDLVSLHGVHLLRGLTSQLLKSPTYFL